MGIDKAKPLHRFASHIITKTISKISFQARVRKGLKDLKERHKQKHYQRDADVIGAVSHEALAGAVYRRI